MLQSKRAPTVLTFVVFLVALFYFSRTRDLYPKWQTAPQRVQLGDLITTDGTSVVGKEAAVAASEASHIEEVGIGGVYTTAPTSKTSQTEKIGSGGANIHHIYEPQHHKAQHNILFFQGGGEFKTADGLHDPQDDIFLAGTTKPAGSNYTKSLIVAKTKHEDTTWIDEEDLGDIRRMIYIVDDPGAQLRTPQNKGREAMVYLSYMIDNYDNLPDVSVFMHSHRWAWHNNDLLNWDSAEMIKRLSSERVQRVGYMSLRCHWAPGCPAWMRPGVEDDHEKEEQVVIAEAWAEIFPGRPIPEVLAQPCCSQFALSRDKIRAVPREAIWAYRDWLQRTPLEDRLSGRVWEYLWQAIFTGHSIYCPDQHGCYCDGYGICFEDNKQFDRWFELKWNKRNLEKDLKEWKEKMEKLEQYRMHGELVDVESGELEIPEPNRNVVLEAQIGQFNQHMEELRSKAIERGTDPRIRAASIGRRWEQGDGY